MKLNRKNKFLVLGIVVISLLGYFLAVKKTLLLQEEYHTLSQRDKLVQNLGMRFSILSKKEKNLDSQLSELNLGASSQQNHLLGVLNKLGVDNGTKIIEFKAPHTIQINNTVSKTHMFTLEGSYNSILRVIHYLEKYGGFGSVSHLNLEKKKDYRNGRLRLQARVFLEQVN